MLNILASGRIYRSTFLLLEHKSIVSCKSYEWAAKQIG